MSVEMHMIVFMHEWNIAIQNVCTIMHTHRPCTQPTLHSLALSLYGGTSNWSTNLSLLKKALSMLSIRLVVRIMIPGNRSMWYRSTPTSTLAYRSVDVLGMRGVKEGGGGREGHDLISLYII